LGHRQNRPKWEIGKAADFLRTQLTSAALDLPSIASNAAAKIDILLGMDNRFYLKTGVTTYIS